MPADVDMLIKEYKPNVLFPLQFYLEFVFRYNEGFY